MLDQYGNDNGEFFPSGGCSKQSKEGGRDAKARGEDGHAVDESVGAIFKEEETVNEGDDVVEAVS